MSGEASPKFPDPIVSVRVEPRSRDDQENLASALSALTKKYPRVTVRQDTETGTTHLCGYSARELYGATAAIHQAIPLNVGRPRVLYLESIREPVTEEGEFNRPPGAPIARDDLGFKSPGFYGRCILRLEPLPRGNGFEFRSETELSHVPSDLVTAVRSGVEEARKVGALTGNPLTDLKVTLVGGSTKDGRSTFLAFKIAAALAFRSGSKKAKPYLLEPIMKLIMAFPMNLEDKVLKDLKTRKATIDGEAGRYPMAFLNATAPLYEVLGYDATIRDIAGPEASVTMDPSHYEELSLRVYREREQSQD